MFRNSSRLLENIPSTNVAMVHSLKFQARTRDIEDFLREFNDLRSLRPALVSGTNAEDKHIQYSTYSVLLSSCECNRGQEGRRWDPEKPRVLRHEVRMVIAVCKIALRLQVRVGSFPVGHLFSEHSHHLGSGSYSAGVNEKV